VSVLDLLQPRSWKWDGLLVWGSISIAARISPACSRSLPLNHRSVLVRRCPPGYLMEDSSAEWAVVFPSITRLCYFKLLYLGTMAA
jgi:hypothetical protein